MSELKNRLGLSKIQHAKSVVVNRELVFKDQDDSLVVISVDVANTLISYRQLALSAPGIHIVIKGISEPSRWDIRSRFRVNRVSKHHQKVVDEAFEISNGTLQYLGEWHTHPEDIPKPSSTDYSSWHTNLKSDLPLVLIIVGRTHFWVGKKNNERIEVLQSI